MLSRACSNTPTFPPFLCTTNHTRRPWSAPYNPHAVAGVQPLHHALAEMRRHIGVQAGVDGPGAQPGGDAQQRHHPPLRHQRVPDQPRAGQQAAAKQHPPHAQSGDQLAAEKAGGQVAGGGHEQQQPHRVKRDGEIQPDRRPGHPQQPVGHAQGNESSENE